MKRTVLPALIAVIFLCTPLWALTGREIMEKNDALPEFKTADSMVLMNIYKGSDVIEKEFEMKAKKLKDDEDAIIISFIRPTQITLLTHTYKTQDDDQWLKLSSGKVKRIASTDKDKPFVNSHFYYEDLGSRDIDKYDFNLLGDGKAVDADCYKVEAVKKTGTKVYDKMILFVRKSDYFIVRIEFFKDGEFHKYLENFEIKKVKNILTPYKAVMALADGSGKTELIMQKVDYNMDMKSSLFDKEALR